MQRLSIIFPIGALLLLASLLGLSQKYTKDFVLARSTGVFEEPAPMRIQLSGGSAQAAVLTAQTLEGSAVIFKAAGVEAYERLQDTARFGLQADLVAVSYLWGWYTQTTHRALIPVTPTFTEAVRARDMSLPYADSLVAAAGESLSTEGAGQVKEKGQTQAIHFFDFIFTQLGVVSDVVLERVGSLLPDYLARAQELVERGTIQFDALFGGKIQLSCCGDIQPGAAAAAAIEDLTAEVGSWSLPVAETEIEQEQKGPSLNTWMAPSAAADLEKLKSQTRPIEASTTTQE